MTVPDVSDTAVLAARLALLSQWIDDGNADRDPEAITWGRIAKIAEENGEAVAAYIGKTGQNRRKGCTHTTGDVIKELLDVAVTALGAVEHLTGNQGDSIERLDQHVEYLLDRVGLQTAVTADVA